MSATRSFGQPGDSDAVANGPDLPAPIDVSRTDICLDLFLLDPGEVAANVRRTITGERPLADRDGEFASLLFYGAGDPVMPHEVPGASEAALQRIRRMDNLRLKGNYAQAIAEGEGYWIGYFNQEFSWPLYLFLSEVCAKICLMLDPLRDKEKVKTWTENLETVRSELIKHKAELEGRPEAIELRFYLLALEVIADFFRTCSLYVESVDHAPLPSAMDEIGGKKLDYSTAVWNMFRSRMRDFREGHGRLQPVTVGQLSMGAGTSRMFDQLKALTIFMEAISDAERDKWASPQADMDASVRTKLLNPHTKEGLRSSTEKLDSFIGSFGGMERENSPLVVAAHLAKVRNLIDQGQYFEAVKLANALLSKFKLPRDAEFISQLYGTVGLGFFVFAELLLKCPDEVVAYQLVDEVKKFSRVPHDNDRLSASALIDMGIGNLRRALRTAHDHGQTALASRFRNQLLFGVGLKLEEGMPIDRAFVMQVVHRCCNDLARIDEPERSRITVPRIAQAVCDIYDRGLNKFDDGPGQALLKEIAQYAEASMVFLEEESLVPLQVATFEHVRHQPLMVQREVAGKVRFVEDLGPAVLDGVELTEGLELPYKPVPWHRLTGEELLTRSRRSSVSVTYFEILEEKKNCVNRFLPNGKKRPVSVIKQRTRRVARYRPTLPIASAVAGDVLPAAGPGFSPHGSQERRTRPIGSMAVTGRSPKNH